jgi:tetratricopeptide (TPR) repeat protein
MIIRASHLILALALALPLSVSARAQVIEEIGGDLDTPLGDGLDEPLPGTAKTPVPKPAKPDKPTQADAPASTKKPDAPASTKTSDEPDVPATDEGIAVNIGIEAQSLSWAGVLERFDARRVAKRAPDAASRSRADSVFEEGLRDFGVHGLPGGLASVGLANALVEESRRAAEAGEPGAAVEVAGMATRIAPDLPPAYSQTAWAKLKASDIGGALASAASWGQAVVRDPESSVLGAAGVLALAVVAVFLVLLLFAVVGLSRALRYLTFDLLNALPRGAARWQVRLLVVLLAALPVVVSAGPVITVLWWVTISWLYFSLREQIVVAVFAALLAPSPYAIEAVSRLMSFPGSRLADAYAATYDAGAVETFDRIERVPEASRSLRERAALASRHKREGRLEEAYVAWRGIVQEHRDVAWAHNNLGVVAALNGKGEHAVAELEAARKADPNLVEATFNLSLILNRKGKQKEAAALIDKVAKVSPAKLEVFRTSTFRRTDQVVGQNRAFVDATPPYDALLDAWRSNDPAAGAIAREVQDVAFYGLRDALAVGLFGVFLVLWGLLYRARARLLPSHACARCGSAASRRYDAEEVPADVCSACFHTFLNPRSGIEAGMKLRKERQVKAYKRARRRWLLLFTLLWPGSGHIYGGAPLRGAPMSFLFAALLVGAALAFGPAPWPHLEGDLPIFVGGAGIGLVLLFLYPVALRGVSGLER